MMTLPPDIELIAWTALFVTIAVVMIGGCGFLAYRSNYNRHHGKG